MLSPSVAGWCALLLVCARALGGSLAAELFAEADYRGSVREARRQLREQPGDSGLELLLALSCLRLDSSDETGLTLLDRLAEEEGEQQWAALVERGLLRERAGRPREAYADWAAVFIGAGDRPSLQQAGAHLERLLDRHPTIDERTLAPQLASARGLWKEAPFGGGCSPKRRAFGIPAGWLVRFYRRQVGAAIGSRCSLAPSCSEYFRQAGARHGWLAIPMIADRLVREPGVVSAAERPVLVGGRWAVADPIEDHDWWRRRKP